MQGRKSSVAVIALDAIAWVTLGFVLWGGYVKDGRPKMTYINDILIATSVLWALVSLATRVSFSETGFGKACLNLFSKDRQWNAASVVMAIAAAYWGLLFIWLPVASHHAFQTSAFDFGIITQSVHNFLNEGVFSTTWLIRESGPTLYFPNNHLNFGLYVFAALKQLTGTSTSILVFQSLSLLAGACIASRLAVQVLEHQLGRAASGLFGFALYWFFDPIHRMNTWDIHEPPFMIPLALASFLFMERQRWGWASLMAVLMAAWREDGWWVCGLMQVLIALRMPKQKTGGRLLAAGLAAVCFAVFPWHAAHMNHVNTMAERYPLFGNSLGEAVKNIVMHPQLLWQAAALNGGFWSRLLVVMGLPVFLFSGWAMIPLALPLLEVGLSQTGMSSWVSHYVGLFAAPLLYATLQGWVRVAPWMKSKFSEKVTGRVFLVSSILVITGLAASESGGMTRIRADRGRIDCLSRMISPLHLDEKLRNAPVIASDPFGAQLSDRPFVTLPFAWNNLPQSEWNRVSLEKAQVFVGLEDQFKDLSKAGKLGELKKVQQWQTASTDCGYTLKIRLEI